MRKFIYLLTLAASIVAAGCSSNEPKSATAIMGHTYRAASGTDYVSIYFANNLTCTYSSNSNGTYTSASQLTYSISGTNVDIYFDNSSTWIASKRGTLFLHLIYYPSSDKLMMDNLTLKRID